MYILFLGDDRYNVGPSNVNKEIIRHKSSRFLCVDYSYKYYKVFDLLFKVMISKVVIVSGISRFNNFAMKISKMIGKKTAYIMHGCAEQESRIDGRKRSEAGLRQERELLQYADIVLPVSKKYSHWIKRWYPQYAEKIHYWQLGVRELPVGENNFKRQKNSIASAGGDWLLKQNHVVSCAVEKLNGMAHLTVYGPVKESAIDNKNKYTQWAGTVDHDVFINELKKKEIFVVNSVIESFNISVIEALGCGCSILVSNNVGAMDIMQLSDQDIIFDTSDENEIADKIMYLLKNPNNKRIRENIKWELLSYDAAIKHLEEICEILVTNKGHKQE